MAAKWPFFYGWVIVAVAFFASGIGSGVAIWGPSVLLIPMTDDLGWSRSAFFTAFFVREILIAITTPIIGPFYDRKFAPRVFAFIGAILLGLSTALIGQVNALWQFIALFGVMGGIAELGSGFFISQAIVPKWFVVKRGRALGFAVMGVGLGALVFPSSISFLINQVGWREAWVWFGLSVGSISLLLALLIRTSPEDEGLLPDGLQPNQLLGADNTNDIVEEISLTRREAIRHPTFWLLLLSFSLVGLGITGFQSNWHPFLTEVGFGPAEASFGIAIYGLMSGIVRPGWGILGERFPVRYLMAIATILTSILILFFLNVRGMSTLIPIMFVAGIVMGGYLILRALLTANYFGRRHIGAINSLFRPFSMGTAALGPLLFGALHDTYGNYQIAFLLAALAWGLAGAIILLARPPITNKNK
ncbi:MAG: hypothetical protein CL743_06335 [Chloroflexi bacterium]|jgi:MFS family permease|nr:hypothetical protein [Chloroflexota bacterium]MCH2532651.1 MFS transporter [Dehalococcoidia bacterium]